MPMTKFSLQTVNIMISKKTSGTTHLMIIQKEMYYSNSTKRDHSVVVVYLMMTQYSYLEDIIEMKAL